jgi:hypothetical protein
MSPWFSDSIVLDRLPGGPCRRQASRGLSVDKDSSWPKAAKPKARLRSGCHLVPRQAFMPEGQPDVAWPLAIVEPGQARPRQAPADR